MWDNTFVVRASRSLVTTSEQDACHPVNVIPTVPPLGEDSTTQTCQNLCSEVLVFHHINYVG